jgi:hypothetical protein
MEAAHSTWNSGTQKRLPFTSEASCRTCRTCRTCSTCRTCRTCRTTDWIQIQLIWGAASLYLFPDEQNRPYRPTWPQHVSHCFTARPKLSKIQVRHRLVGQTVVQRCTEYNRGILFFFRSCLCLNYAMLCPIQVRALATTSLRQV